MARVHFTPHLRQFFELPDVHEVEAATLGEVVAALDAHWPGLGFYVTDERSHVRKHVAVWIDGSLLTDRTALDQAIGNNSEIHILQALSGG